MFEKTYKAKISKISAMHFVKLFVRSAFFFGATVLYILARIKNADGAFGGYEQIPWLLALIWIVYAVEMAFRFFPSRLESPDCQKQFAKNYKPTGEIPPKLQSPKRTLSVAVAWLVPNGKHSRKPLKKKRARS